MLNLGSETNDDQMMYSLIIGRQWNSGFEGESMNGANLYYGSMLESRIGALLDEICIANATFSASKKQVRSKTQSTWGRFFFLPRGVFPCTLRNQTNVSHFRPSSMPKKSSFATASSMERTHWPIDSSCRCLRPMWNQQHWGDPGFSLSGGRGSVV